MKTYLSIFTLLALSTACGPQTKHSELQQAIDANSDPMKTGFAGRLDFQTLAQSFQASADQIAWSDSYWPTVQRGLSHRWGKVEGATESKLGLADFLKTHILEDAKTEKDVNLSPAEKYDILYRWRYGKVLPVEALQALRSASETKEGSFASLSDLSKKREVFLGFANDLNRSRDFQSAFPLSRDGWTSWFSRNANKDRKFLDEQGSGDDWSWEGICHGWAPAALFEKAPKHSVEVSIDDQKIFLSEGDIRGLLSYSWANHSPWKQQYFIGRRCEKDVTNPKSRGPLDSSGRNLYGTLQKEKDGPKLDFSLVEELDLSHLTENWMFNGGIKDLAGLRFYEVQLADQASTNFILELQYNSITYGSYEGYVFADTREAMDRFIKQRDGSAIKDLASVEIYGCGDVNPAVLHTNIIQALKIDKVGFVMDRTQSGQVWNQPVYSADVKVKDKIMLDTDLFKRYHNPQKNNFLVRFSKATSYLVPVAVTLSWAAEPSAPQLVYPASFDQDMSQNKTRLQYLLEFNDEDELVGGEWGTLESTQPSSEVPDFMYGYKKGSKPYDVLSEGFDYSGIIGKIHDCSLKDQVDGVKTLGSREAGYVKCEIQKAQ